MASIRHFLLRILSLFRDGYSERELNRELESHLALLEDEFEARGLSPAEAKVAARRKLGGVDQTKERHRDARSFRWIDDGRRDVVYAFRSLRRSPGFTFAAVLTLSIGIGTTTAIYSVVDRVLLQPLPFPDAHRLVRITEPERPRQMPGVTHAEYVDWRSRMTTVSGLAGVTLNPQALIRTREGTVRLAAGLVSTNYFEVLGSKALLGRTLLSSDDQSLEVMVLSFDSWQRYFHGDPGVIGSTIELRSSDQLLTIVGVMPPDEEQLGSPIDVYVPILPGSRFGLGPMIGRLKDGVPIDAAWQEANIVGQALRPPRPEAAAPLTRPRFGVEPLKDNLVSELQPALRVFLATVAVVLLIVCANLANLLLARGAARQREIAVRLAIGASRGRIVRQVLTECLLLALLGGVLGALIGAAGVAIVRELASVPAEGLFRLVFRDNLLPRANEVRVDYRVLVTALSLSALTSIVFGLLPAWHLSRTCHPGAMGLRGGGVTRRDARVRTGLVLGQLVMATVLLIGAGLLVGSFLNLSRVEKGYDPSHALAFQLVLPPEYSTARKAETIEVLLGRLRRTRGVEAAGFAYAGILIGIEDTVGTWVPPGRTVEELAGDQAKPRLKTLSRGYFEAMGVRVIDGRGFDERDSEHAPPVAVLNRTLARRFFGDGSPVGSTLAWHGGGVKGNPLLVEIVGVVEDIRQGPVSRPAYSEVFMDYRQIIAAQQRRGATPQTVEHFAFGFLSFGIRTTGDPFGAIAMVRQTINSVDANAGLDAIVPMEQLVANSIARQRYYAVMLGVLAVAAGLLAAIGVYGVLAYSVEQRTQEIGVRMALGAERHQVLALVLRRGLVLAALGIAIGIAGALAGARYLQSMLFGVEPRDPSTFIVVAASFAVVAAIASYLPARRATRVDPIVALRVD